MTPPALFQLDYGPISLDVIKTNTIDRTPVMTDDGADLLYEKWEIEVEGIYNPETVSYAGSPPVAGCGNFPAETDAAIHWTLMQPRQVLVYTVNGVILLHSPSDPQGDLDVDAYVGPQPVECAVKQIGSTKTWVVTFRIITWVRQCPQPMKYPLISNRYEVAHQVDDSHMTTIVTSGVAVFASDALAATQNAAGVSAIADSFRASACPSSPGTSGAWRSGSTSPPTARA